MPSIHSSVNSSGQIIPEVVVDSSVSSINARQGQPLGTTLADSASGAAAAISATLAAAAAVTTYIRGLSVTGAGATAASIIEVTVTGLATTLRFKITVPAGATVGTTPLAVDFGREIPASAANTAIVVNVPSFGAGNTAASVAAWGYRA